MWSLLGYVHVDSWQLLADTERAWTVVWCCCTGPYGIHHTAGAMPHSPANCFTTVGVM